MRYVSTRGNSPAVSLAQAIVHGLAPDGGLYVPEEMPRIDADSLRGGSQVEVGHAVLNAFRGPSDPDATAAIEHAFRDPVRLEQFDQDTQFLELYWGASAAFKDYGAQFLGKYLPACHRAVHPAGGRVTVMVATSGDTGGAVAAAFWRVPNVDVFVLYPHGRVSPRQEHQLCAWGENVQAIAVNGSFDECQALVKAAFTDPHWTDGRFLTSANSINIGRLLPQVVYYAWASLQHPTPPSFIIPTGNLGNALACIWAKELGFPVGDIVLATNANPTLLHYYESGDYQGRPSIRTLANAMDVGTPSNMERLQRLYPTHAAFTGAVRVVSTDDETIAATIALVAKSSSRILDPHTACAMHARATLHDHAGPWILAATAHPAKFETIVEPLIGREVPLPPALTEILRRAVSNVRIEPTLDALRAVS